VAYTVKLVLKQIKTVNNDDKNICKECDLMWFLGGIDLSLDVSAELFWPFIFF